MFVELGYNKGFSWNTIENNYCKLYYKGYFDEEKEIVDSLLQVDDFEEFVKKVGLIRGCFSIVLKRTECIWAAVDQARSFPLFYSDDGKIISDMADTIRRKKHIDMESVDIDMYASMLAKRYSDPGTTVYKEILQLRAGEACQLRINHILKEQYYQHLRIEIIRDYTVLLKEFNAKASKMIEDLLPSLKGKRIILPLSGGYDSRLIAVLLKKYNYSNVICYTYGRREDYEVRYSEKVAKVLGYEWHCVEYTGEKWKSFFEKKDVLEYFDATHNHCSLPHIQDYIALQYLVDNNIISKGDVVIPGFCGDFPAGSYIGGIEFEHYDLSMLCNYIYREHFINVKIQRHEKEKLIYKIEEYFIQNKMIINDKLSFISAYEKWLIESRLSMWVVNSVRVYEHFDLSWRLPMWSKEYLDFWYSVPSEYRKNCKLYQDAILNGIFKEYHIAFIKPAPSTTHSNRIKSCIATLLKKHLIYASMIINKDLYKRNNINNYNVAALYLLRKLKSRKGYKFDSLSVHLIEQLWWCQKKYGIKNYNKVLVK